MKNIIPSLIAIAILLLLFGCNAEKKALKPYKAVNSDVSNDFKEKKKELIARVCAVNFPTEIKTIVKDSITTRVVKVQDNNQINRLKKLLKDCQSDINIDSLVLVDTIFINKYHTNTITLKDTIGSYYRQLNEDALRDTTNKYKAENTSLKTQLDDTNKKLVIASNNSDKWKIRCILALVALVLSYGVYGYFKLRNSLMPKI